MAEQLRYKVTADTSQFVQGMKQVQASSVKANKAVRNQGQAFTQLAYALDDAQYGFRGVQNNLQAIAVTAGASGPVVLGLTAIIVALGWVISNFESANKELVAAKKNFEELTKVILSSDEQIIKDGATIQEQNKKTLSQLQKQLEAGRKLSYTTKTGKAVFIDLTDKEIKALQEQITELEGVIGKNSTLIKQAKGRIKYAKELKRIKESEDIAEFAIEPPGEGGDPFTDAFGDTDDLFGLENVPDIIEDTTEAVDDLESALQQVGSPLAGLSFAAAKTFKEIEEKLEKAEKSIKENFAGTMISAFESIATAEGNFASNLGKGMLSAIGSMLIQLGTAAILAGIAKNSIVPGSGAKDIINGGLVVAGGIALKAGAAAIGRGGGRGPKAATGGSGGTPSTSVTPTGIQGSGSGGGIVGVVRGDDLRLLNERQSDTYRGRN